MTHRLSALGEAMGHRARRRPAAPLVPCPTCSSRVRSQDLGQCATCQKPICIQCGCLISVHGVQQSEDSLGLTHSFDEEVCRSGICSTPCAEPRLSEALVTCLMDALRDQLRWAKVNVDHSRGLYGPEFELHLVGLPAAVRDPLLQYCQAPVEQRMPFRFLLEGLLADRPQVEGGGGDRWVYLDPIDRSQYTLLRGKDLVLPRAREFARQDPGSVWQAQWDGAVKGIAGTLAGAGRFEEAARVYEIGGFMEEAGKARAQVKSSSLTADIASLIRAFRETGLVSVYRCPSCGAAIRISKDTPDKHWHTCEYCGNSFHETDVADFLRTILGSSGTAASTGPSS